MSGNDQDILKIYLQKVMELSDARSSGPTEAELRNIAREVGISEAELAAAARSAQDHKTRGLGFLEHQRYDDAATELSEAAALAPNQLDIQHALAQAYAGRYQQRGHGQDRQRAESLARRCLELDPDHRASFELLNELDQGTSSSSARRPGSTTKVGMAIAIPLILGLVLLLFENSPPSNPTTAEGTSRSTVENTVATESAPPPSDPTDAAAPSEEATDTAELDIPIELDTSSAPELELGFDLRLSRLNNYTTGRSFYTLNAVVENRGSTELEKITARLQFRDADHQILKEKDLELHSSSAPPLRPGDQQAVHQLEEVVPSLSRVDLVVERVEQTPAADDYGVVGPVQLHWQEPQPQGMALSARERARRYSENTFAQDGGGYFEAVLEIENTGARSIRALKLKATITGPDNAWTTEIERHVVTKSGPDLRADGSRIVRFLGQVQERPAEYRVSVVGVQ